MKRTIIAVLLFILTQFLGTFAAAVILIICKIGTLGSDFSLQEFQQMYMVQITTIGLVMSHFLMFFILWALKYFKPSDFIKKVPGKTLLACIVMIFFGLFSLDILNSALDLPNILEDAFSEMSKSVPAILSIAIFGPAIEELVFRRIVIDECTTYFKGRQWAAIIMSSALFGLVHMNPAQMVFAAGAGILFGWIYCRTGSMLPGFVGHVINNSIGVIDMRTHVMEKAIGGDEISLFNDPTLMIALVCSLVIVGITAYIIKNETKAQ